MSEVSRFAKLSKPAGTAPAKKLFKIKQDRVIRAGRLSPVDPFKGLHIEFADHVEDMGDPEPDLDEGACLALVMRWVWTRLSGSGDKAFVEGTLEDLGQMHVTYRDAIGSETDVQGKGEQHLQALRELAKACHLQLVDVKLDPVRADAFSVRNLHAFAQDVRKRLPEKPAGTAWVLGFTMRNRVDGPDGATAVKYEGHALGIFVTSETASGLSPLIIFDPNAGVYQLRDSDESDIRFLDELETIYGHKSPVQLTLSAQAKLAER